MTRELETLTGGPTRVKVISERLLAPRRVHKFQVLCGIMLVPAVVLAPAGPASAYFPPDPMTIIAPLVSAPWTSASPPGSVSCPPALLCNSEDHCKFEKACP